MPLAHPVLSDGVQMHYCGCDIQIQSVVAVSLPVISSSWASLYRPVPPSVVDPNEAPTEVAPSIPAMEEGETLQFLLEPRYLRSAHRRALKERKS